MCMRVKVFRLKYVQVQVLLFVCIFIMLNSTLIFNICLVTLPFVIYVLYIDVQRKTTFHLKHIIHLKSTTVHLLHWLPFKSQAVCEKMLNHCKKPLKSEQLYRKTMHTAWSFFLAALASSERSKLQRQKCNMSDVCPTRTKWKGEGSWQRRGHGRM